MFTSSSITWSVVVIHIAIIKQFATTNSIGLHLIREPFEFWKC